MNFLNFLNESKGIEKAKILPKKLLPKAKSYDYYDLGVENLDTSGTSVLEFLEKHKLIKIEHDDVWNLMRTSEEPIDPSSVIFSMVAYCLKEWLQENHPYIGATIDEKYQYISINYEHDDDLDGMTYLEELLGLDDYGYVEEGKLKPLDKNSGYKGKFNY